jgi:hypothetical protein
MIDHVIMFRADGLSEQGQAQLLDKLRTLRDVPGVVEATVGKNFGARSRGFDYCLRVTFRCKADLDRYEADPHHLEVVAYNRSVTTEHICVDFEW